MTPKVNLQDFIAAVKLQRAPGNYKTSGLIIRRKGTDNLSIQDIRDSLPAHVFLEVDSSTEDNNITTHLKQAFEERKWLFIYLADGSLSKLLREQLSRLKDSNAVFIQGKSKDENFFCDLPENSRVIVLIDEGSVAKVEYPDFLGLFGPVIEV